MINHVEVRDTKDKKAVYRRKILKLIMCTIVSSTFQLSSFSAYAERQEKKVLIVFFSKTNNTRTVASQIHAVVGGDIIELKTVKPYPVDHEENVRQAVFERRSNVSDI